jgi:hypothetical protein
LKSLAHLILRLGHGSFASHKNGDNSEKNRNTTPLINRMCTKIRVARWYIFSTKNSNLGIFRRSSKWKMLAYFIAIRNTQQPSGISYGHLVYFFPILVCFTKINLATLTKMRGNLPKWQIFRREKNRFVRIFR